VHFPLHARGGAGVRARAGLRLALALGCALVVGGGCATAPPTEPRAHAPSTPSLEGVIPHTLTLRDFRLKSGAVLPEVVVAYETYGTLAPGGRNAILVSHGNTSTFHAAGRYAPGRVPAHVPDTLGWWDALIGPGKALDTDRYFVVSSNMLGGAYGTTGPRSLDPRTGKPYGPDFPAITLEDMVAVQHALLGALGVRHLVAAAGVSYGGFLSFQWGITYPDEVDGLVVVVSGPDSSGDDAALAKLQRQLARDPNWNGGRYYDRGGIVAALTDLRVETLISYGMDEELAKTIPDPAARAAELRRRAEPWAREFDGNSLLVQRRAMSYRKQSAAFPRIHAKVLHIRSTTDKLFRPALGPVVVGQLRAAGVDATYFELVSGKGHSAGTADAAKFAQPLREFLQALR